jgi:8-oxo-dGTP pyrophosphatase MutT (NUDIX family)
MTPNRQLLTRRLLITLPIAFLISAFYTLATRRAAYLVSTTDNGIKYDQSSSQPQHSNYNNNIQNNHLKMGDLDQDYTKDDYRAFLFAQHPVHGLLLLYCSRKKKKSPHFQAPGGHVDNADFHIASGRIKSGKRDINTSSSHPLLVLACKIGAARELYEETGIDLRNSLNRLQPIPLRDADSNNVNEKDDDLTCRFKHRLFFKICLTDADFVTEGFDSKMGLGLSQSMNTDPPKLMIKLSHEHQGFIFEPNPMKAVDLLIQHSGGKVSTALGMAIVNGQMKDVTPSSAQKKEVESKVIGKPRADEAKDEKDKGMLDCFNCC